MPADQVLYLPSFYFHFLLSLLLPCSLSVLLFSCGVAFLDISFSLSFSSAILSLDFFSLSLLFPGSLSLCFLSALNSHIFSSALSFSFLVS